jgi:hypothetical protein
MICANQYSRILVVANFFTENNHKLFQITHLGPNSNIAIQLLVVCYGFSWSSRGRSSLMAGQ